MGGGRDGSERLDNRQRLGALFTLSVLLYLERSAFPSFVKGEPTLASLPKSAAGRLMSAFYTGYFVTQLPGGWLAWRYGGEIVLVRSTLVWGLLTVVVSDYGDLGGPPWVLPLLRVAIGCLQGVAFPAIHSVLADALAAEDRPRAVALVTSGMYAGTAMAQLGLGQCAAVRVELAWIGVIAVIWAGLYHRLTVGQTAQGGGAVVGEVVPLARRERPALRRFLQSPALLVLLLQSFAFHWTFYTLLSWLPFRNDTSTPPPPPQRDPPGYLSTIVRVFYLSLRGAGCV